jgi:hypothetical protein
MEKGWGNDPFFVQIARFPSSYRLHVQGKCKGQTMEWRILLSVFDCIIIMRTNNGRLSPRTRGHLCLVWL